MTFVSVIITIEKDSPIVKQSLGSLARQLHDYYELIFVISDLYPASQNIIKEFNRHLPSSCVRSICEITHGLNLAEMRNVGIEKADGELITFLGSNAVWYPTHLTNLVTAHDKFPNCNAYFDGYSEQDYGRDDYRIVKVSDDNDLFNTCNYFDLYQKLQFNLPQLSYMAFPNEVCKREKFNPAFDIWEDVDFISRTAIHSCMGYCNVVGGKLFSENQVMNFSKPLKPIPVPAEYWLIDNYKDNPAVHYFAFEMFMKSISMNLQIGNKETAYSQLKRSPPRPKEYHGVRNKIRLASLKLRLRQKIPLLSDDVFRGRNKNLIYMEEEF